MKTPTNPFARMLCNVFGHRYRITRKITHHITEYQCSCCKQEITSTVNGRLDPLTPELKEINETLAHFYRKRYSLKTVA
ncbi:hypothetical protein [Robertkochia aurantiaca]|uniref:hypothetical protein n=1 Tax=Robertkochia aurantiaca TaxID=2873700 RepID=UPI001CCC2436|nr:hypothetical protein [Robertkochia sp. 3YJGBD-33]